MTTKLTLPEMEELLALHEKAEFEMDIDATMATLVENPAYELPSIGWYILGREAVFETYQRMLRGSDIRNVWADKRVHAISDSTLCREAYVYFDTAGGRVTGQYFTVIEFEDDKIRGERMYTDAAWSSELGLMLGGEDFGKVPGVSRLADMVPPPVPRLDRAAVHAANQNH